MSKCTQPDPLCPNIICTNPYVLNPDTCNCDCTITSCESGFQLIDCECKLAVIDEIECEENYAPNSNGVCVCVLTCESGFILDPIACTCIEDEVVNEEEEIEEEEEETISFECPDELPLCSRCDRENEEIISCTDNQCCNPITGECSDIGSVCIFGNQQGTVNENCDCIVSNTVGPKRRNPIGTSCGDPNITELIKTGPGCFDVVDGTVNHCWGEDTLRNVFTCCDPTTNRFCNCC